MKAGRGFYGGSLRVPDLRVPDLRVPEGVG
jgi:hypothetical protein